MTSHSRDNLPNFMLIGAAKSGTTSLAYYLSQHPDVYIPAEKETHFFSFDALYDKGIDFYGRTFFADAARFRARADATPAYVHRYEKVIPRIQADLGQDLKFVVLLRDPVRRAWSHYLHQLRNAREDLSFEEAMTKEDERAAADPDSWLGYFKDGLYSQQLSAWFDAFGRERFLVLKQSDLAAQPIETVNAVFRFIGVSPLESLDLSRKNPQAVPRSRWLMRLMSMNFPGRDWLKNRMPPEWRRGALVWIRRRNTRPSREGELPRLSAETERVLRQRYAPEFDRLEALLGESYDEWREGGAASATKAS